MARPIDATEGPEGSYNCRYMNYLGSRAVSLKAVGGILFVPFVYMVAMTAVASLAASRAAKLHEGAPLDARHRRLISLCAPGHTVCVM